MPTERFLRLSEEKRRAIWQAAMEEFSSVPFEKVSINKIVQRAGISRGSFYTYFTDKEELLSYVLIDAGDRWIEGWLEKLDQCDGDFAVSMELMLEDMIAYSRQNDLTAMHKNMMHARESINIIGPPCEEKTNNICRSIMEHINCEKYQIRDCRTLQMVLGMASVVMQACLLRILIGKEEIEECKKDFTLAIQILCHGICGGAVNGNPMQTGQ